jgi:hypothetical protein
MDHVTKVLVGGGGLRHNVRPIDVPQCLPPPPPPPTQRPPLHERRHPTDDLNKEYLIATRGRGISKNWRRPFFGLQGLSRGASSLRDLSMAVPLHETTQFARRCFCVFPGRPRQRAPPAPVPLAARRRPLCGCALGARGAGWRRVAAQVHAGQPGPPRLAHIPRTRPSPSAHGSYGGSGIVGLRRGTAVHARPHPRLLHKGGTATAICHRAAATAVTITATTTALSVDLSRRQRRSRCQSRRRSWRRRLAPRPVHIAACTKLTETI